MSRNAPGVLVPALPDTFPLRTARSVAWSHAERESRESMVMKKQLKKIVLAKETLRHLSSEEVEEAAGGSILPNTQFNSCRCPTLSCKPGFC